MKHPPTDEQVVIYDDMSTGKGHTMINSLAGCGKSTTLEMDKDPGIYLVFNKRNADEGKKKQLPGEGGELPEIPLCWDIKTLNGFGHGVWTEATKMRLEVSKRKCGDILRGMIKEANKFRQGELWPIYWDILSAVEMAKAVGYIPNGKFSPVKGLVTIEQLEDILEDKLGELATEYLDKVLTASITAAFNGNCDYNDQIYMPAMFGGPIPYYPKIRVDEFQDLNPMNHILIDQLVAKGDNRLFGVGDPCQNIYKFRGAKQGGMAEAVRKYNMKGLDLSISFRCPKAIVEYARWRAPKFKWIKEGGHVEQLKSLKAEEFDENATIICRNNAPLFRLAMQLIASGRSVSVMGSDIGPRVVGIMKKLSWDQEIPRRAVIYAINEWRAAKLEQESKTAGDIADCMLAFAERGETLAQAIAYAEWLFKQDGQIKMLTGHKSKGLEFECVYLLDTFLLREEEQDMNLRYVMQTRSTDRLYEINSADIIWS